MPRQALCVIGAGPAGYAAAMRAHDLKKDVTIIERGRVGGVGIHSGALSSKTMWHLSRDFALACRTDRGYRATGIEVSYAAVMATVRAAVSERRALLQRQLDHLGQVPAGQGRVSLRLGRARVVTPNAVEVLAADGSVSLVEAEHILVATGSRPRVPDGISVDGQLVVTSDHLEEFPDFPKSMVVVGAGVVGCEYASIFANFGRTTINLIDRAPRILPFEDADVAQVISANFLRAGVTLHSDSSLESLKVVDGQVEYVIANAAGHRQKIRVERALISVGRVPATRGLGLEEIGVSIERSGGIEVRNTQSTTVPNIWAAGDATMDLALVNVAELEGRHAVERMFGLDPAPIRYEALSAIMFLMPEVASVGLNELQAQKKQVPYRVSVLHNSLNARNIAMRSTDGFIKLLASRGAPARVLGLRVVGPMASSTIQGIAFLIEQRATLEDIDFCVHPHPAITEGVQECARILLGRSIHKADVFSDLLRAGEG